MEPNRNAEPNRHAEPNRPRRGAKPPPRGASRPAPSRASVGPRRRTRTSQVLITPRDRLLLEMAAEHRLILPGHAAALLGVSSTTAAARLRALHRGGYLARERLLAGQPACYQITRRGLDVLGSELPPPRLDVRAYAHDVGLAWLWLVARSETFGPMREVLSERTLRSRDGQRQSRLQAGSPPAAGPLGVRLGGVGPGGRERLHYPDMLLITPQGHRIAVELELTSKGRARRERILAGYGSDPRIDAVLYLVDQPALARSVRTSARRLGISAHVHVQWVSQPDHSVRPRRLGADRTHALARQPAGGIYRRFLFSKSPYTRRAGVFNLQISLFIRGRLETMLPQAQNGPRHIFP